MLNILPHIVVDAGGFTEVHCLFSLRFLPRLEGVVFGAYFWYMEHVLGLEEDSMEILKLVKTLNVMESMLHH